ncbi:hypothetical protein PSTG_11743 [Puccinia striiformis f. sp. tritici PST-78]|uniref:Uncharacterized protein n=1 Tax=Puccinia striiformis f. sp. tritici PST-78 TaxID=1165861 RepID=A0A0L0V6P0_9BASI|nr:hypothetical protein PSTG_11743 [Puccinia striiformis f. sp. tritici PST-78]
MPSHLRNGRDLSGEQRRRNVKAGLTNPTGQRPFQRLEGQSPIHGTSSDERPGSEPRSRSDACQLQSHLLSTKIRNVHAGTLTSGPLEGTSSGFTGSRESGAHQQSGTHFSVATDSSSESRQPAAGNVYKHVPCPAINVRSSSTKQQHSSHESCTSSSGVQPRTHQPNAKPNGDDGSMWQLVSRLGSRDDGISAKSVGERENGLQFRTDLHSSSYPSVETNLASKGRNNGLPGSYPGATNGSYSFVKLVSPPRRPEPSGCTDVVPRAEPRPLCRSGLSTNLEPSSSPLRSKPDKRADHERSRELCALRESERDELPDLYGPERGELPGVHGPERDELSGAYSPGRGERSGSEFRAELRDAVTANPQPSYVRAPQTPSTPAGLTRTYLVHTTITHITFQA